MRLSKSQVDPNTQLVSNGSKTSSYLSNTLHKEEPGLVPNADIDNGEPDLKPDGDKKAKKKKKKKKRKAEDQLEPDSKRIKKKKKKKKEAGDEDADEKPKKKKKKANKVKADE